ncbi:MAG: Cof-type HAD-IIB family hydrolase [Solobacterium sp.]|nr:Cof-type HAD-IIB family hydrolase [Solobacterium sp.]
MKLIFLDIDGTLVTAGSNVPPESALKAIKEAQALGHKVFLCTGRNYGMLSPLLKYGFDGMVAAGGGYVMVGDEVIYDCPMPDEDRDKALEVLHRNGVFCTIEAKDNTYGDANLGEFLKNAEGGNSEIERWRKALSESLNIRPMNEYAGEPIYKIVIMCQKAEQLDEARSLLEKDYEFMIQEVSEHGNVQNGDLVNRRFDKGRGIIRIAEKLHVDISDTIGFGDSMNDLQMIETVGTSVCMANGAKALQKISDLVVPSVEEDGLYEGFRKLKLINE